MALVYNWSGQVLDNLSINYLVGTTWRSLKLDPYSHPNAFEGVQINVPKCDRIQILDNKVVVAECPSVHVPSFYLMTTTAHGNIRADKFNIFPLKAIVGEFYMNLINPIPKTPDTAIAAYHLNPRNGNTGLNGDVKIIMPIINSYESFAKYLNFDDMTGNQNQNQNPPEPNPPEPKFHCKKLDVYVEPKPKYKSPCSYWLIIFLIILVVVSVIWVLAYSFRKD